MLGAPQADPLGPEPPTGQIIDIFVNWTDEEGSRFGHSLMGSGAWAGVYPLPKVYGLRDTEGVTVEQALTASQRSQLGAHYTPRPYVERIVEGEANMNLKAAFAAPLT